MTTATEQFRRARDFLLEHREDYATAHRDFAWPRPDRFNWALDWFDAIADGNDRTALHLVEEDGGETRLSFAELSRRSDQVANWLRERGVAAEDRVLVMLGNQAELWETALAAMKLRAVVIPATPLLGPADLRDRVERGRVRHVIVRSADAAKFDEVPGDYTRIAVGEEPGGAWLPYADAYGASDAFAADGPTLADDPLMLYFTSGTTARPKLVEHTHTSYPIGHLATMYWIGLRPGDVHLNISSPGWAKHAWSNLFAPWNAEATVFLHNYTRFDAPRLMAEMDKAGVTTFCAPPTVWRMLIQADLGLLRTPPREVVAAGEPLNPEVIEQVRRAWGVTIRDGFGQTETAVQVSNSPGQVLKAGSMGRPSPGYRVELLDPVSGAPGAAEGEIALDLSERPVGLMTGYHGDPDRTAEAMARRLLPHRRHRLPRRGRLHHVRRPRGRRVQGVRLQDQSVRAGERAAGARGGRGGGRGARPGRAAAGRAEGVHRARRRLGARTRHREGPLRALPADAGPLQAAAPPGVRRAAQDRLRQDPPHRAARGDGGGSTAEYREEDFR